MVSSNRIINERILKAWPQSSVNTVLTKEEKIFYRNKIKYLLKKKNACLVTHYYVDSEVQSLTEETGGIIGDSLTMARLARSNTAKILIISGVKFMGESAKVLNWNKKVIMPTLDAQCSLSIGCQEEDFKSFIQDNPNRTVVVYVNTSARIGAMADWIVTSANALDICQYLKDNGEKILWAPDKHLGHWIKEKTSADMISYNGSCIVHEEFKFQALLDLKKSYPDAAILVHPESPKEIISLADVVGSTSVLLNSSKKLKNSVFIVATEAGILYQMKKYSPDKLFIKAPTIGKGGDCKSCSYCPWMKMNNLKNLADSLEEEKNEITVPYSIRKKVLLPLNRMLNFSI